MSTGFESQVTQLYIKLFLYQRSYVIVLIVRSIFHTLKYQSRELLSPLLAGLESQFI